MRQDNNESEARMTRGLALIQSNGKSILENADGSLPSPLRRVIKLMKLGYLVTGSFAPVLTLSIARLTLVNTFMLSSYGLQ